MIWNAIQTIVRSFWFLILFFVLGAFAHFFGFDRTADTIITFSVVWLFAIPIFALGSLRREEARIDKDGNPYGRVSLAASLLLLSVAGYFLYLAIPPLTGLQIWNYADKELPRENRQIEIVFMFFALWIIAYTLIARVRWNETGMTKTSVFFITLSRKWDNLTDIDETEEFLKFSGGIKVFVPRAFEGHKDLIAYAKERLEHLDTSQGRNSSDQATGLRGILNRMRFRPAGVILVVSTMLLIAVIFAQSIRAGPGTFSFFNVLSLGSLFAFGVSGGLLLSSGREEPRIAEDGRRYGHVFLRVRVVSTVLFAPMAIYLIWQLPWAWSNTSIFVLALSGIVVCCHFLRYAWRAEISWNDEELQVTTPYLLRKVTYKWDDLESVKDTTGPFIADLTFSPKGTVKIDWAIEGSRHLITYAKVRLEKDGST